MYYIIANAAKSQEEIPLLQHFFEYLPPKPYCTDTLGMLYIRPKAYAVGKTYLQPNPITRAYWLVFDLDNQHEPRYWAAEPHIPLPNLTVINRSNGHEHVYYLIDPAVYTLRQARRKPLELAADVDRGLTEVLDADPGYGKLLAKNPFHEQWIGVVWHEHAYGLTELLDWIPDQFRLLKRKRKAKEEIGLGRNCTVFEVARQYAYSEWRRLKFTDYEGLYDRVRIRAMEMNADFTTPMTEREVLCIVRSVTKWTARHLTADRFAVWGDARREKSIITRHTRSQERAAAVKALYAGGKTQKQIAAILGISERQVRTLLKSESLPISG
jgi:hypothetical protein